MRRTVAVFPHLRDEQTSMNSALRHILSRPRYELAPLDTTGLSMPNFQ